MEFQRYNLSEADLNEDLKKSKSNITLMHRALIRLPMILRKVKSWSKPKSLFWKGAAISGILTVLIIFIDLIINRTLITQYIFVLTYALIVFAAIYGTGTNMNLITIV